MLPDLYLSNWMAWSQRHSLPEQAGVYLIAHTAPENVVYVGRTWGSGGLRGRIYDFNRSATTGQKGHAGGVTYHGKLGPDVSALLVRVHVPVAINPDFRIMRPYIEYAERRFIWEHVARHGACQPATASDGKLCCLSPLADNNTSADKDRFAPLFSRL